MVEAVARECARAQDPLTLYERVATLLRRRLPYDSAGWLLVDPDTMLLNAVYEEDVPREGSTEELELRLASIDETACPLFLGRYFRGVRNGASPKWLQDRLAAIDLHWHDLRHEAACRLLAEHVDIRTIQLMLGHAAQTLRYARQALEVRLRFGDDR